MTRRAAIIATLLAPVANSQFADEKKAKPELPSESVALLHITLSENHPALRVSFNGETITFSSKEVMEALRK